MSGADRINPKTGKRVSWEREQAALKAAETADVELHKQIGLLKRQQKALEARDKLLPFVKFTMPDPEDPNDVERSRYKDAKHHRAIARVLEEVVKGEIQFLILTAPPRHGKSELVSRRLPAWFAGKFPEQNVVVATYNDDFAMDFGKDVRFIMQSPQYKQIFPKAALRRGGAASNRLQTTEGGMLTFVGVGGTLTGRGAHLLIIDDIISNAEQAQSQTIRDKMWDWFVSVALTRRMGKKLVIITFTRWHNDDIIGRLTDPDNPKFNRDLASKIKVINFPAIAEEDDPLGRQPGEALWPDGPDQFDAQFLEDFRAVDPLKFAALYQQRPSLADGDMFKREDIRFYRPDDLPEDLRIYAASDHAVATGQRNDFTVLLKVGVDKQSNIYILECDWRKMKSDVATEAMLGMCRSQHKPLLWWAEKGHISKSIGPFLHKRMLETNTYVNIREVTPVADKMQRAQSIAARVAMGKVFFPQGPKWVEKAINEMMAFPTGTHDDFCLAADTEITMASGARKRIDEVQVGDFVATRNGPRAVTAAAQTNVSAEVFRVILSNGVRLFATGNHPVYVSDKGFVRVDTLAYGDVVTCERQDHTWRKMKCLSTEGIGTEGIQTASTDTIAATSTPQSHDAAFSTGTFGKTISGLFRTVSRYITATKIRSTTAWTTLNVFRALGIAPFISANDPRQSTTTPIYRLSKISRNVGMGVKTVWRGTALTASKVGKTEILQKPFACVAERSNSRTSQSGSSSATIPAVHVIAVEALTTRMPVYNLTVDGEHEYFANGVLTHNCDALAYIGLGLQSQFAAGDKSGKRRKETPEFGTLAWVKHTERWQNEERAIQMAGGF